MLQFKQPGVYTQIQASGVRSIAGAATSVGLFVGPTPSGIDLRRTRVQNFGEFERLYGGLSQSSNLSYGVLHFFANGGTEAFIIRVPPKNSLPAAIALKRDNGGTQAAIVLTALSSGLASNDIFAEIDSYDIGGDPFTTTAANRRLFSLTLTHAKTGVTERFGGLSMASSNARFAPLVVNDPATGSKLVSLTIEPSAVDTERPVATGTAYELKPLPMAAPVKFPDPVKVTVAVSVRDAAGTAASALSFTIVDVEVFAKDSLKPLTPREIASRLEAAINLKIRSDQTAQAKMEGVEIRVSAAENGKYLWIRTGGPGETLPAQRILDATVTLVAPSAGSTSFITENINGAAAGTNVSRYRLGTHYLPANSEQPVDSRCVTGVEGDASGQPDSTAFMNAITALEDPDPFFNILCLPDLVRPAATDPKALHHASAFTSIYPEAARICSIKHAFLLIDPPPNAVDVASAEAFKGITLALPATSARSSAAYFPNIRVDDPLAANTITDRPPSGAMAGLYARTDAQYGVWQAPAGTEAVIAGAHGPSVDLSDAQHGTLNVLGLNCIRKFPIYGVVSYGSRTADGANAVASEWKYVPVIRTASYILRSLSEGLRWAVHKPNGEVLWSQLRLNTTAFLHGMFRQGAFKGTSAREAYFVQCDASTTSPDDINQGVVNIVVGFAPLKPAEFVVISLRQIVQSAV
jgi:uncharacterized protein